MPKFLFPAENPSVETLSGNKGNKGLTITNYSIFAIIASNGSTVGSPLSVETMLSRFRYMNPYDVHKSIINDYVLKRPGDTKLFKRDTSKDKRDIDVIRENHQFLWDDNTPDTWETNLAKKYYDKLFKEYCICDLVLYRENKIAMRWRIDQEVISGKGQFICGNKKCSAEEELRSWEVNFAYVENGEKKNALVKLRLCPECSDKLNYHSKKREIKAKKKKRKHKHKHKKDKRRKNDDQDSETDEKESDEMEKTDEAETADSAEKDTPSTSIWATAAPVEKTREQEFQEYLDDLLL